MVANNSFYEVGFPIYSSCVDVSKCFPCLISSFIGISNSEAIPHTELFCALIKPQR